MNEPHRTTRTALLFLLPLVASTPSVLAQALPPLPALPLDSYQPGIREPIAAAYEDAREKPGDPARNGILGMVLYAHEQYEYSTPCFERAHAMDAGEGRWSYYLGRAELYVGNHDAAIAAFLETLRLQPTYVPAQVMLAQALLEGGAEDDAFSVYQELAEALPDIAEVHYGLGRIYAAREEPAEAIDHLEKACALSPGFGAAHFALARVYRDQGQTDKAREHLARYQDNKTGWPTLDDPFLADIVDMRDSGTDHLRRGVHLAEEGRFEEAAEAHEAALREDPGLVTAHLNLIRIYGELDDVEKAEEHYHAALGLDPDRAEIHYNHGVLLAGKGRGDEAGEAFRRALELKPAYAEAHNNYAYLLMTAGKLDEAIEHYRAAVAEKPDYRDAHFNLGRILVNQGRVVEAIEHFRQTLTPEDEQTPRCTYALGAAYAKLGNRPLALRYMEEAWFKARALEQEELMGSIERDMAALRQAPGFR